ncbi:MAG: hypothetical protein PVI06_00435 [Desulfobacterales bacterium]|jgi:hypothetical protein
MMSGTKGRITFRIAAILFFLSALLEIFSVTSNVPLLGALRGGIIAVVYHLVYIALFVGLGIGLWRATPWGYKLVFATTLIYTLDKALYLLYRDAMKAWLKRQFISYADIWQYIEIETFLNWITLVMLLFVACWWGFAGYTYLRREYFGLGQKSDVPASSM